jgi:hypothetical protein
MQSAGSAAAGCRWHCSCCCLNAACLARQAAVSFQDVNFATFLLTNCLFRWCCWCCCFLGGHHLGCHERVAVLLTMLLLLLLLLLLHRLTALALV